MQLTLALHYLHKEKHVTHRDLKPSNLMIGDTYKLTISKAGISLTLELVKSAIEPMPNKVLEPMAIQIEPMPNTMLPQLEPMLNNNTQLTLVWPSRRGESSVSCSPQLEHRPIGGKKLVM